MEGPFLSSASVGTLSSAAIIPSVRSGHPSDAFHVRYSTSSYFYACFSSCDYFPALSTASTIAPPPKTAIFFNERFNMRLIDTTKHAMENISSNIILFAKGNRTMASGCQRVWYVRSYGRELVSKPEILLKKSWGGHRKTTLSSLFSGTRCTKNK